ncbi:sulfatase-like hydrolase/transferase [Pseudoalteromonas sp. GB56]
MWNISSYHRGMMGGTTPNIDRIANEGMMFMDHYAQASCTAGRAAFILGQYPIRASLSTVGLPDAKEGIQTSDPSLATMLKAQGYTTGQFGKNHLGDRDEHLPTNQGIDEFSANLYHLTAGDFTEQIENDGRANALLIYLRTRCQVALNAGWQPLIPSLTSLLASIDTL